MPTCLMNNIQITNVKDLNVKLFDVRHSNDECQNDTNVEHQKVKIIIIIIIIIINIIIIIVVIIIIMIHKISLDITFIV